MTPQSYYGRPILKPHVWKAYIAWYFFTGGLAGTSASLALCARLAKNSGLARTATFAAGAGAAASTALLIVDLGKLERFVNMMRVVKPTSPMNLGAWTLATFGAASGCALLGELTGAKVPVARRAAEIVAGVLGIPLSVYTAVLLADTATPVWHEARNELPFLFAGGAAASAGAFSAIFAPHAFSKPARRLAVAGAVAEVLSDRRMHAASGRWPSRMRKMKRARISASRASVRWPARSPCWGLEKRVRARPSPAR